MKIVNLSLQNYKSFKNIEINFDSFNVIVGANAAGKSNLISSFKFIKNIITLGVENAIALQGGMANLKNSRSIKDDPISISFALDFNNSPFSDNRRLIRSIKTALKLVSLNCSFTLLPYKRRDGYSIISDEIKIIYDISKYNVNEKSVKQFDELNETLDLTYSRKNSKSDVVVTVDTNLDEKDKIQKHFSDDFICTILKEDKKELMLNKLPLFLPPRFSADNFISLYDFDPKMLKHSSSIASLNTLKENGENLAVILQNLLKNKENRKKLTTLLSNTLPFITNLDVEKNYDQSFSFRVRETFSSKTYLANYLSDGTVSVLAIIIALYFEPLSTTVLLEEPERNIHPNLLNKIVEMAKDVSSKKQVVFTTHNPEILRYVSLQDILLIKRDEEGNSQIVKPNESETVKCFMDNELGIDDLFLQNFLGE